MELHTESKFYSTSFPYKGFLQSLQKDGHLLLLKQASLIVLTIYWTTWWLLPGRSVSLLRYPKQMLIQITLSFKSGRALSKNLFKHNLLVCSFWMSHLHCHLRPLPSECLWIWMGCMTGWLAVYSLGEHVLLKRHRLILKISERMQISEFKVIGLCDTL